MPNFARHRHNLNQLAADYHGKSLSKFSAKLVEDYWRKGEKIKTKQVYSESAVVKLSQQFCQSIITLQEKIVWSERYLGKCFWPKKYLSRKLKKKKNEIFGQKIIFGQKWHLYKIAKKHYIMHNL